MSQKGLIASFTEHRLAANLLMLLMVMGGLYGLQQLNRQLFPNFDFDYITVSVPWRGASPEDIERAITVPVEQNLKTLANMRRLTSRSEQGRSIFFMEMEDGTDLSLAISDVRQRISTIRNLPQDAEQPIVQKIDRFSPIANILVYTERGSLAELRPLVRRMENELLARGIGQVQFAGLPAEEMAIQIPAATLHELGLTLDELALRIRQFSDDIPAGTVGRNEAAKQLRGLGQRRDEGGFADLPLFTDQTGRLLRLGDIALIERRPRDEQPYMTFRGFPAIELQVLRAEHDDSLKSAAIMQQWIEEARASLPDGMHMHVYFETWKHLRDRIETLLWNGITGLILVIATLFFFLNARVAWWVTVGIPVSFMATLGVLLLMGGTINMISLFGLILALGIIVDDAIVVGEDTLTHLQQGESPLRAAIGGARRMFWPVVASSLTTIAAFLPLAMMGGAMGKIAFDIPFVMICVIIASLIECFLILPGHLHHSFARAPIQIGGVRERLDLRFHRFREETFRPIVRRAIEHRHAVVTAAFCAFFLAVTVVATGWLKFTFFPPVDGDQLRAVAEFSAGTDQRTVNRFLDHLEETLHQTDAEFDDDIVETVVQIHRSASGFPSIVAGRAKLGDHYGTLLVEVWTGNERRTSNDAFIRAWRKKIILPPGLDQLTIGQPEAGPPGSPVALRLGGSDIATLKAASLELQQALNRYAGISNVDDDLPWGKEQLTFELTPEARALGLTLTSVAAQLRSAFDGSLAQLFNDHDEEVEVRVMLPDSERGSLSALDRMPVIAPNGDTLLLSDVVTFSSRQGVDMLRRVDGRLSVVVSADLDPERGNANQIIASLTNEVLPDIRARYHISVDVEGKLKEQAENLRDVRTGQMLALALIYIILAWVFSSWSWPIAIMTAILFGFTGAVIGHLFMGMFGVKFSMFSIMGLFGLAGIIVNDSIVLVSFFRQLVADGMDRFEAIVEACVRRLRAVLLTSITTVAGLTPILFESSLQAQFLKPMAVSLVFGLSFGTVLILLVVPSMLMIIEETKPKLETLRQRLLQGLMPTRLPATVSGIWHFDPRQYRRAAEPEPGLKGSLLWPAGLLVLFSLQLASHLLATLPGQLGQHGPRAALVIAVIAGLLVGWQTVRVLAALLGQQLALRARVQALVMAGVPLILIASIASRLDPALHELAASQWQLAVRLLIEGGLSIVLLRWLRRARVTFRR
ncbi:MAG: efflux RND transporter permease subunit [Alcanivoracaceae bacterium]